MSESEKDKNVTEKNKKKPEPQKKKGFYAALYGGVGLMLTLAAVIGYRTFAPDTLSPNPQLGLSDSAGYQEEDRAVGNSFEEPGSFGYLTPEDRGQASDIGEPLLESSPNDVAKAEPKTDPQMEPTTTPKPVTVVPSATPAPTATAPPSTGDVTGAEGYPDGVTQVEPPDDGASVRPDDGEGIIYGVSSTDLEDEPDSIMVVPTFRAYEEGQTMDWPLTGEIVMAFSMDHVVYDKTLDQYRTNDSICIAAEQDAAVRAAAEGLVISVTSSREKGKTVVLDHGNGWRTTYCQLQDDVPVSVGSVVAQGQVLGSIGEPSLYSVLLGPHLDFTVTRSGTVVNPLDVFAKE